ncbi:MAG: Ig-like domain-containing protein [Planctomycetes bacterium]|nr:Ig-like domain-containing protein [Planctomycetota bacterium]
MERKQKIDKPPTVAGVVVIGISKRPSVKEIEEERFLVEYFMDGVLIYKTSGRNLKGTAAFDFELDTTKYKNGLHKITVNFWDQNGPSAIGFKKIIIKHKEPEVRQE